MSAMRLLTRIIPATLAIAFSIAVSAKESTVIPEIEMVDVEGGTFTMGLDEGEAEHLYETPKHEVTLSDFRIGKYEVTQELWEAVMGENPSISKGDKLSVENISWYDIQVFIKKLNKLTGKNIVCQRKPNGSLLQEVEIRPPDILLSVVIIQTLRHGVPTIHGCSRIQLVQKCQTNLVYMIWAEMCLNGCRTGTEIIQRKTKGIPMELRSQT